MEKMRKENYEPICQYVNDVQTRLENEEEVSKELRSAMREFSEKSHELHENFDRSKIKESAIEIEQAADSALRVARASKAPRNLTIQVEDAHDKVRDFKKKVHQ